MRLRDFVCDVLHRFYVLFNKPIGLPDVDVEKRERFVQTYLIVFGLLLSYDRDLALQKNLMLSFMAFLLASLFYYATLIRPFGGKIGHNFMVFLMACAFGNAFVTCYVTFVGPVGGIVGMLVLFFIIASLAAFPLLVGGSVSIVFWMSVLFLMVLYLVAFQLLV